MSYVSIMSNYDSTYHFIILDAKISSYNAVYLLEGVIFSIFLISGVLTGESLDLVVGQRRRLWRHSLL